MKPHKHCDLIKAWADGAEIQAYDQILAKWVDVGVLIWDENHEYRIKPREFEEGAFYPVLDVLGDKEVAWYSYGNFYLTDESRSCNLEDLTWIGEKLEIEWPEE